MNKVLVDTGPLVAWFDRNDQDHTRAAGFFHGFRGQLISTWPVLTEVCHLVPQHVVERFMRWVANGGLQVREIPTEALGEITALLAKYDDLPMDLADASLVWLAQAIAVRDIVTLDDRDFGVYRIKGGRVLNNLLRPLLRP